MGIYAIDMGHTITGLGTGAVGILNETDINREVGKKLINMLREKGHIVYDCTVDKSSNDLYDRVQKANATNAEFYLSIHLNSFSNPTANGTETYVYPSANSSTKAKAKAINDALVNTLKTTNRGVKEANFYVIKNTKMPAALVELFFITNKDDCNKYSVNKCAEALFKGLTGVDYTATIISSNTTVNSNFSTGLYKVNTATLNVRKEAKLSSKIATTISKNEVYTITDVVKNDGYTWGKLKSGAGYIALEYCIKI